MSDSTPPARSEEETSVGATCPNCGSPHVEVFCPVCGQKERPLRQSALHFIREAFREYFGLDGRLWTTLRLLVLQPGELTSEAFRGRRARYVPPLRLYLSTTLLFFFLLSVLDPVGAIQDRIGDGTPTDTTMTVAARMGEIDSEIKTRDAALADLRISDGANTRRLDSLNGLLEGIKVTTFPADSTLRLSLRDAVEIAEDVQDETQDSIDAVSLGTRERRRLMWQRGILAGFPPDSTIRPVDLRDAAELVFPGGASGGFDISFGASKSESSTVRALREARTQREFSSAIGAFARDVIGRIPVVMFFLLPAFALIFKVVYIRRDFYYSEHLIFALHNHAVAFLVFSVVAALLGFSGGADWAGTVSNVLTFGLMVYFYLAQKRVYGQGSFKTLVKYLLVFGLYWTNAVFFGAILALGLTAMFG